MSTGASSSECKATPDERAALMLAWGPFTCNVVKGMSKMPLRRATRLYQGRRESLAYLRTRYCGRRCVTWAGFTSATPDIHQAAVQCRRQPGHGRILHPGLCQSLIAPFFDLWGVGIAPRDCRWRF